MATENVQSFLRHELRIVNDAMRCSNQVDSHGSLTSDTQQLTQLSNSINNQLLKAMKEYGESRKFVEAKIDTYDYFFSRIIEYADDIELPFSPVTFDTVGSRGEGLGFLANDTDIVTTSTITSACFPSYGKVLDNMLIIDTTGCHPGYCKLKFHRGNRMDSRILPPECTENTNRDIFLTNTFNVTFLKDTDIQKTAPFDCTVHGPALRNESLQHDYVNAIRCESSHDLLDVYLSRHRTWPNKSVLDRMRTIHCAVVTASHPNSAQSSLEFRISFATVEKFLIRNFCENQFACYSFLKVVKRRIETDNVGLKGVLKSYYIKTALLWISEQLEPGIWTDKNFLFCTSICLSYLHHAFCSRNLPQLFQPENNLVDHLQPEDCIRLASALERYILPVNAKMFMRCCCNDQFEENFNKLLARPRRNLHEGIAHILQRISTMKLPINMISQLVESGTVAFYLIGCKAAADSVLCQVLYQMIIRDLENIMAQDMAACIRSLLYRQLASIIHRQPRFVRNNNKLAEEFYKNSLTMVYPISGFDDQELSGKTNLALFHYLNGDYKDAMTVLGDVENKLLQADIYRTLLIFFVMEDLPRLWRDPALTEMVQTVPLETQEMPVKYNVLGFYILAKCMDELDYKGEISIKRAKLQKLKLAVLANEKKLHALEKSHRIYTAIVLEAAYTIITALIAKFQYLSS